MKELSKYLECGCVASTHGVRGNVRLENRCDSPEVLASLKRVFVKKGGEYKEIKVLHASVQKNMVLAKLEGVETVESASAMKGCVLYAAREDFRLEKGTHFVVDLLGLPVIDNKSGEILGELSDILRPGAQQVYVVKTETSSFMIPVVEEFVREISLGEEKPEGIYVELIEGMME